MLIMKKIAFTFLILFLFNCSNPDEVLAPEVEQPIQPQPERIDLFNINEVPEITLEVEVKDWNKFLQNYDLNPKNDKKVVSHFTFNSNGRTITLDSIGLRMKGNTSRRRPEGVTGEMHNSENTDWHHCHFGLDFSKYKEEQHFEGLDKLNLKWFKDDATYAREIYCYDLFKRFGCWTAPRASYCRLNIKIKGDANPAYFGVYAMIENIDEIYINSHQEQWGNGIGYLWKAGWSGNNNANFYSTNIMGVEDVSLDASKSIYYAYDLKTRKEELDGAKAELTEFIQNLKNKTGESFENWIVQKMDVELFLKTYATNVVVGMWDDYWVNGNNFYFYFASNGKAYFIPYDYDNTLGTSLLVSNSGTQNPLFWGNMNNRPLVTKILSVPKYKTLYKNYISELVNSNNDLFNAKYSINRIQNWHNKISPYISNDTGEDMIIEDKPASWGNQPNYRLKSGNDKGGSNGDANFFETRTSYILW